MIVTYKYCSPAGELVLGDASGRLCMCDWATASHSVAVMARICRHFRCDVKEGMTKVLEQTVNQLDEYFEGKRREFDLPLSLVGTELQKAVWQALVNIGYGELVSYKGLATLVGRERAVRAVANAVGGNGLSIIVPCHRVIGSDGSLTGYAGGIEAKRLLIEIEKGDQITSRLANRR